MTGTIYLPQFIDEVLGTFLFWKSLQSSSNQITHTTGYFLWLSREVPRMNERFNEFWSGHVGCEQTRTRNHIRWNMFDVFFSLFSLVPTLFSVKKRRKFSETRIFVAMASFYFELKNEKNFHFAFRSEMCPWQNSPALGVLFLFSSCLFLVVKWHDLLVV